MEEQAGDLASLFGTKAELYCTVASLGSQSKGRGFLRSSSRHTRESYSSLILDLCKRANWKDEQTLAKRKLESNNIALSPLIPTAFLLDMVPGQGETSAPNQAQFSLLHELKHV